MTISMADMWRFHQLRVLHPSAPPDIIMRFMKASSALSASAETSPAVIGEEAVVVQQVVKPRNKGKGKRVKDGLASTDSHLATKQRSEGTAGSFKGNGTQSMEASAVHGRDISPNRASAVKRNTKSKPKPTMDTAKPILPPTGPAPSGSPIKTGRPKQHTQGLEPAGSITANELVEAKPLNKGKKVKAGHQSSAGVQAGVDNGAKANNITELNASSVPDVPARTGAPALLSAVQTVVTGMAPKKDKEGRKQKDVTEGTAKFEKAAKKAKKVKRVKNAIADAAQTTDKADGSKSARTSTTTANPSYQSGHSTPDHSALRPLVTLTLSDKPASEPVPTSVIPPSDPASPVSEATPVNSAKKRKKAHDMTPAEAEAERERKERKRRRKEKRAARAGAAAIGTSAPEVAGHGASAAGSGAENGAVPSSPALVAVRKPGHLTWATETPDVIRKAKSPKIKSNKKAAARNAHGDNHVVHPQTSSPSIPVAFPLPAGSRPSPEHSPSRQMFTPPQYSVPPHLHAFGPDETPLTPMTPTTTRPGAYLTGHRNALITYMNRKHLSTQQASDPENGYEYDELATPCQPVLFARRR